MEYMGKIMWNLESKDLDSLPILITTFDFKQVTSLFVCEFPHSKMGLIASSRVMGELNKMPFI